MGSRDHTVVVIAHRLSTIRNADKIALIGEGKVIEQGSHEELLNKHHGRYKRLFESSKRDTSVSSTTLRLSQITKINDGETEEEEEEEEEEIDWEAKIEEDEKKAFNAKRAREMASPDKYYFLVGSVGAVMAGGVFPMWGVLFSEMIDLLFRRVYYCSEEEDIYPEGWTSGEISCNDYWQVEADDMQETSFRVAGYWAVVIAGCLLGNVLTFWGFGMASERLSKRVRDQSFTSLLRQEVAFFDKQSVGRITSQLQDDAARIHAFSGEPVRSFIVAFSSVVTGVILAFIVSAARTLCS
jgi:ATP-binding cassette subfamily B (MDR/TAP) protein 1